MLSGGNNNGSPLSGVTQGMLLKREDGVKFASMLFFKARLSIASARAIRFFY
jgi:hypothetical protein